MPLGTPSCSSSPWMRPTVDVPDPLPGQMGVELGRGDTRMSEQLLDDPQVGPAFEQVRRERVAQGVRADLAGQTGGGRGRRDGRPRLLAGEAPTAVAEEQRAATDRLDVVQGEQPRAGA